MSEHIIDLVGINKSYGDTEVIKDLNLYIRKNEFITLLGPSGCGKTTTLRIIGGFEQPDAGRVMFDGKEINNVPAHKRKINTVFQKYSLFPNMNIYENIAFGLRIKKLDEKEVKEKISSMLKLVNLEGYEKRAPDSLSGGQQQRIAIARALVNEPEVLLLDEPLGALDLKLRKEMQLELKKMQQALGITFIYVTHDQEEALTMSDTIVVMNSGVIQQIDTPTSIYNEPKNAFVAQFIGESNLISGVMIKDKLVELLGVEFECVDTGFEKEEDVDVVIRPEDVKITEKDKGIVNGVVKDIIFKGVHYEITVCANDFNWLVQSTKMPQINEEVGLKVAPYDIQIMKIANNLITGWVVEENRVEIGNVKFECKAQFVDADEAVNVYVRPQDIEIVDEKDSKLSGEVLSVRDKGEDYEILVQVEDFTLIIHTYKKLSVGSNIFIDIKPKFIKVKRREYNEQ